VKSGVSPTFTPTVKVPASGAVIGDEEKAAMHAVVDKGWLTSSIENARFEQALSDFTGIRGVRTCNSGSSANLLAVAAMVELGHWKPGDEIITVAACFPTTINPLFLYGLKPVFVDIQLPTYNVNLDHVLRAVSYKTRGIVLAHTLGNPFDVALYRIAERFGLKVIEDCCDALGAMYDGQHVGTLADVATCSFFPAHHITTGEGGAVFSRHADVIRAVESIASWGRDCWCEPGTNNSCGQRFSQQFGQLPYGYDHKSTTTRLGFNLKLTDVAAACGLVQIARLREYISARNRNFDFLRGRLERLSGVLVLPEATACAEPSWFGFPITIREEGQRQHLQRYLAERGVDSRLLFAGNITKQPYMAGRTYLTASTLEITDKVMNDCLWIGLHPALSEDQLQHSVDCISEFFGEFA
jgi:CDP-6-deoxy-D-xylo-4-hexulose-3-dehydrase